MVTVGNETMTNRISNADPASWDTFNLKHLIPTGNRGICLDLGCGPGAKKDLENYGYTYIGLDLRPTSGNHVVADAEKLPFGNASIELVIAASSFEHFPDPMQAAKEVARVLKPGGHFVGSISFLEPYHAHSHFHLTHLGAKKIFENTGLTIDKMEPFEWTGPEAISQAIYQCSIARWLTAAIIRPSLWLRRTMLNILLRYYRHDPKKERIEEFINEEKYRFTAGIKIKASKHYNKL